MAYLDDVIIPSMTVEEGLNCLIKIFKIFKDAGLAINLKKYHFFKFRIEYLGFEVSISGVQPCQRKLESVREFPIPKCARDVRSFLGLASYFRRFVKDFKKNAMFSWDDEQNEAFKIIKIALMSKPLLAIYSHETETEVHTDACVLGLGAVLFQKQPDGKWHPVSFYSQRTIPEEERYHSYELEALAIVCALEKFRVYLLGIHFVIKIDCNSLKMLGNKRDLSPRVGRWFVRLSEFDYSIEYQKGERNSMTDALSRNPVGAPENTDVEGLPILGIRLNTDWVAAM
ncbi:Retrovirus-related Pol polyprotein from transposon 17.6 [Anthophora quadrimaculata]